MTKNHLGFSFHEYSKLNNEGIKILKTRMFWENNFDKINIFNEEIKVISNIIIAMNLIIAIINGTLI